jgi:hypothetical protein
VGKCNRRNKLWGLTSKEPLRGLVFTGSGAFAGMTGGRGKRDWTMQLAMFAGWLNRDHQDVTEYLKEENKILREKSAKRRMEIRTSRTNL